ncbi:hypothetical protein [Blastococcus sp. TF02A-26]|uniref:hypothetical protein n=1 Tax=Blastococcus sp. TF02A-26 TaxID=2250577 RepID=UPI000DEA6310|nr:hypothetical protein [Blastococcus sp. TF02A-26]RBY84663.1 hypothetical protein DQ240_13495 [Blastococcus sp. TF02A-26]
MTEPSRPRPVPGPPPGAASEASTPAPFADLDQRPVAEHVDVFEAEHARLERELRTIDQL